MQTVTRVSGLLSLLSCLGSGCVVFSYISLPGLRKHPSIMVVFLSVCDFLYSLKFVAVGLSATLLDLQYTQRHDEAWCRAGAMWGQFWGMSSISWNAMLSLNVVINLRDPFKSTTRFLKFYHLFVWSIATTTSIVLFFHPQSLGPNGEGTCGIARADNPLRLLFYLPLICYFCMGFFCLGLALKSMADLQNPRLFQTSQRRAWMLRMILVVLVFILCWTGPTIHRGAELITGQTIDRDNAGAFWYLDIASLSIQGFINALVWFANPDFIAEMRERWANFQNRRTEHGLNPNETERMILLEPEALPSLDAMRRKDIISCLLLGIEDSALGKTRDTSDHIDSEEFPELIDIDQLTDPSPKTAADFRFFDYQPTVFAKFRSLDGITTPDYLKSLNAHNFMQGANLKVSDGKSGSFFCFSPDKKFILKTVFPHEAKFLNTIISYLHTYFSEEKHSFIAKFYGFHGVQVPFGKIIHMVVMANVLETNLRIDDVYDLKGSWVNRTRKGRKAKIGLDLDFQRRLNIADDLKPLYLDQIAKDAKFLAKLGIMDYSMLLGIHTVAEEPEHRFVADNGEPAPAPRTAHRWKYGVVSQDVKEMYFIGIIDILQYFNWTKKIEVFLKTRVLFKDSKGVSCIPPQQYAQRFIQAMNAILHNKQEKV